MLEWLHMRGFQKHKNRRIDFDRYCTTIVGVNDAGKTASLRALEWLTFNSPSGNEFFNWHCDSCIVSAGVDGHEIVRKKSKKINYYKLDGKKYKAPGTKVPEKIASLLNINDLNFQRQHDPTFMLTCSPGQISRELNTVIDLQEIDSIMANASSSLRKCKEVETLTADRLQQAREKKQQLKWVKEFDKDLQEIEKLQDRIGEERAKCVSVTTALKNYRYHSEEADDAAAFVLDASRLLTTKVELQQVQAEVAGLRSAIEECRINRQILEVPIPDITHLVFIQKKYDKVHKEKNSLNSALASYQINLEQMEEADKDILFKKKQLQRLMKGKRCPTCGQKIKS